MIDTPTTPETPAPASAEPTTVPVTEPAAIKPTKPAQQQRISAKASAQAIWATGRRKEAIARVRLVPGTGRILVNSQSYEDYFPREVWRVAVRQALFLPHQLGKHDVVARVEGGGISGQAGAIRLGIARAIVKMDPAHRPTLRTGGLLTRDPRMKERKKYGQKGARKRFQWTKR